MLKWITARGAYIAQWALNLKRKKNSGREDTFYFYVMCIYCLRA